MPKWLGDDEFMTGAELATITKQDTSRFIGVRLRERDGNFEVSIKHGGRTLSLGSFSLEREAEAAAAYDAAARPGSENCIGFIGLPIQTYSLP